MPRRYRRTEVDVFQKRDISIPLFPIGEGSPIFLSIRGSAWVRLAPGQGTILSFDGEDGGAFAWGVTTTLVAIWVYSPPQGVERAYCHHLSTGPIDPLVHQAALAELGCGPTADPHRLRVLLAGRREVVESDERPFLRLGVRPDRLITYSNAFLTQFGVSRRGCVGEAG